MTRSSVPPSSTPLPARPFAALDAWFARRTAALSGPRAPFIAALLVPLLTGLLALLYGQDDNWDLHNYHWYNAHALLHGRMAVDMAPGQWQSYFNPTLDLPYYLLASTLPGPVAGFIVGLLHGLNFILLLLIARQVLDGAAPAPAQRYRLPLLLALAGVMGTGFLSEVGNTMGDNLTSLLVLGAVAIALKCWGRGIVLAAVAAGFTMGLGTGLKLTNATFAVALCLAYFAVPVPFWRRVWLAFVFGIGTLAGIAVTAGWWFWTMWQTFGNPVFPQFNNIFRSPLAQPFGVIDTDHLPRSLGEAALWPFVFTLDAKRVSEVALKLAAWPVLYVLAFVAIGCVLYRRAAKDGAAGGNAAPATLTPRAAFLLVFAGVSYLAWLKLFGIYRYLIPVELLLPLLAWLLLRCVWQETTARRVALGLLVLHAAMAFSPSGWGHAPWARQSFSAQVPAFAQPASSIVFTAHGDPPMGWMATFMPKDVSVIALGGGFPETPAYLERVQEKLARRAGPHFAMLAAARQDEPAVLSRTLKVARALGLTDSAASCARLARILGAIRPKQEMALLPGAPDGQHCTVLLRNAPPQPDRSNTPDPNVPVIAAAKAKLANYGLELDGGSCRVYPAAVGGTSHPYQLCRVTVTPR